VFAIGVYLLTAAWASAAAGDLDTSFATNGRFVQNIHTNVVPSTDKATDVVVQPDGRIVIVGSTFVSNPPSITDRGWSVLRLSSTGAPDGFGGPIFSEGSEPSNGANALGLQPDGRLLLTGGSGGMGGNEIVARLTTSGAYDTGFGTLSDGHPFIDFAGFDGAGVGTDSAYDLVRQPDGGIVTAGFSDNQFAIARVSSAGLIDNSFDADGRQRVDFSGVFDGALAVALSGTKIVSAGITQDGSGNTKFAILSLNSNGTPDASFGVGTGRSESGVSELPRGANALAVQPDGKILVAGPGGGNFGVGRVKTDGFYDPTFGPSANGQVAIDFGGDDVANAMALQPDGKILVAGTDGDGFAVARLTPDGALDPSFGAGGKATVNFTGVDVAAGIALQPDGRIVLVGSTGPAGGTTDYAITRLLGDPAAPAAATPAATPPAKKCKKKKKKHRAASSKKKSCKKKKKR
jgi:uncharacterized delta-60 repeat protein